MTSERYYGLISIINWKKFTTGRELIKAVLIEKTAEGTFEPKHEVSRVNVV